MDQKGGGIGGSLTFSLKEDVARKVLEREYGRKINPQNANLLIECEGVMDSKNTVNSQVVESVFKNKKT